MSSLNLKLGKTCHGWKREKKNLLTHRCQKSTMRTLLWECPLVSGQYGYLCDGFYRMHFLDARMNCDVLWDVRPQWSESPMCCPAGKLDPLGTHAANDWQIVSSVAYQWCWIIKSSPWSSVIQFYRTDFLRPLTWAKSKAPASPSDWITSECTRLSWKQKVTAEYAFKKC